MKKLNKSLALIPFIFIACVTLKNETAFKTPVNWECVSKKINDTIYLISLNAKIDSSWHLYSQTLPSDEGPLPTIITFEENSDIELLGVTQESEFITHYDPNFQMDLNYFENEAIFTQKIKVNKTPTVVKGGINFMVCNEEMCLPPTDEFFELKIK